ncbi:unnamed protein product, partial [Polarella glacialis]
VEQMVFVVNVYTKGVTMDKVSNAYCRILDQEGQEMARFVLREGKGESGLLIARLFREPGGDRWGFQAVGSFCRGQTWKDSLRDMGPLVQKTARELQQRSLSGVSTNDAQPMAYAPGQASHGGPVQGHVVAHAPPAPKKKEDCCVQ